MDRNLAIAIILLVVLGLLVIFWVLTIWWRNNLRESLAHARTGLRHRKTFPSTTYPDSRNDETRLRAREVERDTQRDVRPEPAPTSKRNEGKKLAASHLETYQPEVSDTHGGQEQSTKPASPAGEWSSEAAPEQPEPASGGWTSDEPQTEHQSEPAGNEWSSTAGISETSGIPGGWSSEPATQEPQGQWRSNDGFDPRF